MIHFNSHEDISSRADISVHLEVFFLSVLHKSLGTRRQVGPWLKPPMPVAWPLHVQVWHQDGVICYLFSLCRLSGYVLRLRTLPSTTNPWMSWLRLVLSRHSGSFLLLVTYFAASPICYFCGPYIKEFKATTSVVLSVNLSYVLNTFFVYCACWCQFHPATLQYTLRHETFVTTFHKSAQSNHWNFPVGIATLLNEFYHWMAWIKVHSLIFHCRFGVLHMLL